MMNTNLTLVSGFWNINRDKWAHHGRALTKYLENAKRMMTVKHPLIVFIQPDLVDWVKEQRSEYITVIPLNLEDLKYYSVKDKMDEIIGSNEFKNGLADPTVPEVTNSLYNIIMWSKLSLVMKGIALNPYKSSLFGWIDFGIHTNMLHEEHLGKEIYTNVPNKIKFLCRSQPQQTDLDIVKFFKSHTNRLAGTSFTADIEHFKKFDELNDKVIKIALENNVVDCDQSIFAICSLLEPSLFTFHYGGWDDLIVKYN